MLIAATMQGAGPSYGCPANAGPWLQNTTIYAVLDCNHSRHGPGLRHVCGGAQARQRALLLLINLTAHVRAGPGKQPHLCHVRVGVQAGQRVLSLHQRPHEGGLVKPVGALCTMPLVHVMQWVVNVRSI